VRTYTVHDKPGRPPVLVREGFSWGALVLGPVWLAARGAWIPAALALLGFMAIAVLTRGAAEAALWAGLAVLLGVAGHDLRRWALRLHGYALVHVVAARDRDAALARLLTGRPDMAAALAA
jgi:Protein of unknown function (DUF2628)